MFLAGTWTGNFQQLRNNLGSTFCFRALCYHPELILRETEIRRIIVQPLSTKSEIRNDNSTSIRPSNINLSISSEIVGSTSYSSKNETKNYEFGSVQCYQLQEKVRVNSLIDRPATFMVIDIETTGFNRKSERIIEIALRDLSGGKNSTFSTLIKPGKFIPNASIHGISCNMVNKPQVPRFEELIPILLQFVKSRQVGEKPVVFIAHNGRRFDIPFIISEFERCSVEIPSNWVFLDTLPIARQLKKEDGSKLESSSLQSLREYYGFPLVGRAHRAMQDVDILCYVFQRLTYDLKLTPKDIMDRVFSASDLIKGSSKL